MHGCISYIHLRGVGYGFIIILHSPQFHYFSDLNQCSPGTIRLSDGRDQFEGRVEVCSSNGLWGTVSRTGWDFNDAKVACRQLGLLQDSGIRTSNDDDV